MGEGAARLEVPLGLEGEIAKELNRAGPGPGPGARPTIRPNLPPGMTSTPVPESPGPGSGPGARPLSPPWRPKPYDQVFGVHAAGEVVAESLLGLTDVYRAGIERILEEVDVERKALDAAVRLSSERIRKLLGGLGHG